MANNPTGCLTVVFVSDNQVSANGWEAIINCVEPCQEVTAEIESNPEVNSGGSIELDVDAVSDGREVLVGAIMEHLEEAGIHSVTQLALFLHKTYLMMC